MTWTSFEAKCKVCLKAFDVSNMGESALKSREKGKKHIYLSYGNTTSPLKILKLKCTDKKQQLDYKKVDVGFVA